MNTITMKSPAWTREEKDFVEQLHHDGWSPSGIAVRMFEQFGTDRTRHDVEDLIRVYVTIGQNADLIQRRFIPRRKPFDILSLPAPMRDVVEPVNELLISDYSAQRISLLWQTGLLIDVIASTLNFPEGSIVAFARQHPERCPQRVAQPVRPKKLTSLGFCECKFPVEGHGAEALFCAAWVEPEIWYPGEVNRSYCRTHRARGTVAR